MRILTSEEWQQTWHAATERPGLSAQVLMHRAGNAVAQFCTSHFKFQSVCLVCNRDRGEGLAAASMFAGLGFDVAVIILASHLSDLTEDAARFCSRLNAEPVWVATEDDLKGEAVRQALASDLVIDAVADSTFESRLSPLAVKAVAAINNALGTVVSVGVSSGADANSNDPIGERKSNVVFAQGVITFLAPNPAHVFGDLTSGPIAVNELGVQPVLGPNQTGLQVTTGQEVAITFPPRPPGSHKGLYGHVLVIAGSRGKAGAAALAGTAALRTGAGLVTVACPASIQPTVAGFTPELMTEPLQETSAGTISLAAFETVEKLFDGKSVLVIGPGLSTNEETVGFVQRIIETCSLPMVIDADALNAFAGRSSEMTQAKSPFRVLTPHPGEAARLLWVSTSEVQADRLGMARRIAQETGCSVVLKGSKTVVAGMSGETWINLSGNPAMAKAGTGDVLSGMLGAALARQRDGDAGAMRSFFADLSVAATVHLHGLAGDAAREQFNENTVLATDITGGLFEAFRFCDDQRDSGLFYLQR